MRIFDWQTLLSEWNHVLLNSKLTKDIPSQVRQTGWLGRTPAAESAIAAFEGKIQRPLPPSYRQFLGVTDGWALLSVGIEQVWSLENVAWFAERHPDILAALEAIGLDAADLNPMRYGLEVSDFDNGEGIVLIPAVVSDDGEWQAVRLHDTDPAQIYGDFWELMAAELIQLKLDMAFAPNQFGRTDTPLLHEANREKVWLTIAFLEERIQIMARGAANHQTPPAQRIQIQQSASKLKLVLSQLRALKTYDADPVSFSARKTALLESFRQPDFLEANFDIRYLMAYCLSILE